MSHWTKMDFHMLKNIQSIFEIGTMLLKGLVWELTFELTRRGSDVGSQNAATHFALTEYSQ